MRLLQVNNYAPPAGGGTEVYLERLDEHFNDPGSPGECHFCILNGCERTTLRNAFGYQGPDHLLRFVDEAGIDLVVVQNTPFFDAGFLLGRGVPVARIVNDYWYVSAWGGAYDRVTLRPTRLPFRSAWLPTCWLTREGVTRRWYVNDLREKLRLRRQLADFDRVYCFSSEMMEALGRCGLQNLEKMPHGVPEEPSAEPVAREALVQFSAALIRGKGVHLLCDVMERLKDRPYDFVVTGAGPMASRVERAARRGARVRLPGRVPRAELNRLYARSRVFAICSVREPLGLNGMEAFSHGTPCVAFDTGGVREWLRHEENGLLVPAFDRAAFARAVDRLMTDDELHARLSRAAREAFELRHDWRIVVREQERRFRALVAERTPRRADGSGGRR